MADLTIAGTDYEVIADNADMSFTDIGSRRRAFAGNWISSVRSEKREWKFSIYLDDEGSIAFEALQADVERGQIVSVGGDLIGATLDAMVQVTSAPYIPKGETGFRRGCNVTISEN